MQSDIIVIPSRGKLPNSSRSSEYSAAAAEGGGSGTQLGGRDRILVVEDDFLIASEIETALTDAGFEVAGTASTGEEALQLALARSATLAVMDVRLAGDLDGIDTALALFRLHGIRCIFASAYSDQEAQRRAAPAAPLGWLQKPYTMTSLTAKIRAALIELRGRSD
jgi:DNA-binding response OmpR family regulator